ncbi:hypothetical protein JL720_12401 [Aureococcus anophagefferens]|nr:hypothetical protein JL720_12401 [Aureococcus anophagefferens]
MRWVVAACAFALASSQNVLVVYTGDSADSTLSVAQAFAAGASRAGASTKLVLASEAAYDDVRDWADVVALGSGVINGNADPTLLEFLRYWSFSDDLSGQVGASFATGGGAAAGLQPVVEELNRALLTFRLVVVGGDDWRASEAPRARFTAHAGVAVAVGGSDDYSLKYDLAFDDDGHPAFVNISHPLWISTAARVDGFTRDVAGDAFDIPRGCFK